MKKKLISIVSVCLLFVSTVEAKGMKIFDIHEQYFSGTLIKKGEEGYLKEARYDVNNTFVSTNMLFLNGRYMYGLFTVELKKPIKNWNMHIKEKIMSVAYNQSVTIGIYSDTGKDYFFEFYKKGVKINGNNIPLNMKRKITLSISMSNNKVIFSINGKNYLKQDAKDFGSLKKVEVEANNASYEYDDELLSLDIYKAD